MIGIGVIKLYDITEIYPYR